MKPSIFGLGSRIARVAAVVLLCSTLSARSAAQTPGTYGPPLPAPVLNGLPTPPQNPANQAGFMQPMRLPPVAAADEVYQPQPTRFEPFVSNEFQGSAAPDEDGSAIVTDYDLQAHHCATCAGCDERLCLQFDNPAWRLGGWIQQGYTINVDDPDNGQNVPVLFNDRSNEYLLNQAYVYLVKEAQTNGKGWDWGARLDVNYGTDSRFVTVPGLEEHQDRTAKWNGEDERYGIAIPQAYFELGTPIGPYGSTIRVGHFYALGGYETFAAPDNFFYSHSYTYLYGEPFTHSGAMWLAKLSKTTAVGLAATTGWDSLRSNADEWGVRAGVMRKSHDGRTTIALTVHSGRDFSGIVTDDGPQDGPRHWASVVLKHYLTECLYYVFQSDYGYQEDAVVVLDAGSNTIGFDDGQWWGINQYLVYELNPRWSVGLRAEWFRDQDNTRIGLPMRFDPGGPAFDGQDYYAVTAGLQYKPHPNVLLRQELRWDGSNVESNPNAPGVPAGVRPFDDRSSDSQLTLAFDLILHF